MAWNTPGSDNSDGRPPRRDRDGLAGRLDALRGLFGDGGGNNVWRWAGIVFGLWLLFNSFVLVTEQERGVVLRFGNFARVLQPGPHIKAPWPIERVVKVNATQSKAYTENVPVLTRDGNMVDVEVNVQYRIGDPVRYLFGSRNADTVLQQATQSAVRELVGRSDLDSVLGARSALTVTVRERLQSLLRAYRTGLVVTELNLPNARPPEEVKDAFDEAQRASQDKNTAINQAQAYAKQVVPEARGEAARIRTAAEGYRTSTVARAQGDAERFTLLVEQYKQAPDVTRKRLWLDTVEQVLSENRKVVGGDSRQLIYVPMPDPKADAGARRAEAAPLANPELLDPVTTNEPATRTGRTSRPSGREESSR
ncbi:FtsH protease activity modulator HflK [Lysobacter korlensis]|uniref:Protein HflK n=1 Tax=Lysobacter korlensis TaxID=553636 RepID=A0ABV6RLF8_9GAMM